jgi:hypothetical protein
MRAPSSTPLLLTCWAIGLFLGAAAAASGQTSTPDAPPPVAEADAAECARREAIAASIAKLESARTAGTSLEQLLNQLAEIEKRILELRADTGRTCPGHLSLVRLSERFDPIRQELTHERRRLEIGRKPWPEHVKVAVLGNRVELGMTRDQVKAAWGEPRNTDVTPTTRQEQWTYSGPTYLYFTDGALTMIARTRRPRD